MTIWKSGLIIGALALSPIAAVAQGVDLRPENKGPVYERNDRNWDDSAVQGHTYKPDDYRSYERSRADSVSQREAIRIVRRNGLSEIDQVRWSGSNWVIDGVDRGGDEVRYRVNRYGEIVDIDRQS
jgi:hypothetical protein